MEGDLNQVTSRTMYIFLFGVPICLIFSLFFYFLASLSSGAVDLDRDSGSQPEINGDLFQDRSKIADTLAKV